MYVLVNATSSGDILYQCIVLKKRQHKNNIKENVVININSIFCQKRTMNVLNYLHAPTSGDILYLCIVLKKDDTKIKWKKLTVIVYINSIFCQRENDERFKIICNASGKFYIYYSEYLRTYLNWLRTRRSHFIYISINSFISILF
jgi:hypothetical protein